MKIVRVILLIGVFLCLKHSLFCQSIFFENSFNRHGDSNMGVRINMFNNITDRVSIGLQVRYHSLIFAEERSYREVTGGVGMKFIFLENEYIKMYANPNIEFASLYNFGLSSSRDSDRGFDLSGNIGLLKEIVFPFSLNFELGVRSKLFLYDQYPESRYFVMVSAGIHINIANTEEHSGRYGTRRRNRFRR